MRRLSTAVITASEINMKKIATVAIETLNLGYHLRELPTPVILDQARERGLCAGKSAIGFQKSIARSLIRSFRAERTARIDRGARDIEFQPWASRIRRDIGTCIFDRTAPTGRAFLHCKKGTKADLNTAPQEPCRFRRPKDVRADYDTSHVAPAGSTARLGGRQYRIQPLLGSCRQITGTPE